MNKIWTQQPQFATGIDWSNPITRGLLVCINGSNPINLVNNTRVTPLFGAEKIVAGTLGVGLYCGNNAKWAVTSKDIPDRVNGREVSHFAVTQVLSTPQQYSGVLFRGSTSTGMGLSGSTTNISMDLGVSPASNALSVGKVNVVYGRKNQSVSNSFQTASHTFGGNSILSTGAGSAGTLSYDVQTYLGGDERYATSRYMEQIVFLSLVFNKYLTQQEFNSLSANPWQLFQPLPQRIFLPVSAGGDASTSFSATTDAVTNAFSAQSITPSAASFAATTADVTNAFDARVSPLAAFAATTAAPTNAFSASVSPVTSFAATTASPSAIFVANVSPVVSFNATTGAVTANYGAGVGTGCAFSVMTDAPTNAFTASVPVSASFSVTTASPANAFSAEVVAPSSSVSFSATTASPVGNLSASVSPVAQFAATSADAIFVGSATSAVAPLFTQEQLDYLLAYMEANMAVPTAAEIAAAVLVALNATTIPVDMQKTNGVEIIGDGSAANKFRSINA